jgi:3-hydroxyisobutyrate dehydrogenase
MAADAGRVAAVIGLGSMGMGMATSLLRHGFTVQGFDLSPESVSRFVEAGGRAAATPAEAARGAEAVLTVVVTAAQTDTALFGPDGAVSTLQRGCVVVSSATMAPSESRRLAARAAEHGIAYLDAPISGGAERAAAGQLTIMASGSEAAFERARPVLGAIAQTVYELGDEAGIGASFKMVNQLLAGVHIAAACEAITLAKRLGLDIAKVYEVITASAGNSWMFQNRIPHVLAGDYRPRSAVAIFTKDLGILSDIGRERQFPLPITASALQMFLMAAAAGMAADDDSSIARLIARVTGLDLPDAEHAP